MLIEFDALVKRRRQIVDMITAEKLRLQQAISKQLVKSIKRLIAALQRELDDVENMMDAAVAAQPEWRKDEDLLTSVPGIGKQISRVVIAGLPELGKLGPKQITALAGLAPFTQKSGKWNGKSRIHGGRASVRSALFMGALVAMKYNPPLKAFYEKLVAAGKEKMVAIIAVAHKLLIHLNAIVRDGRPWSAALAQTGTGG